MAVMLALLPWGNKLLRKCSNTLRI